MTNFNITKYIASLALTSTLVSTAIADQKEELAKQLANPIASLISIPIQFNYDRDIGLDDKGEKYLTNIQPVIPFSLNDDWNLISRTIVPVVSQEDILPGSGSQSGIGDTVQSLFFSPKLPTENGWIWGAGPVFLIPTATDELLGPDKWGIGPTGVALKQDGSWTYGGLANHIWSVAGDDDTQGISITFIQPFISYTTHSAVTIAFNTESTYNWKTEEWIVPLNLIVTKVMNIGEQLISVGGGMRYWADSPESGAEGFGVRLMFTMLFPK